MNRLGFFSRLLLAFLLVVSAAGAVLYAVSSALIPSFLRVHLESMNLAQTASPGTATMLTDLAAGYRAALTESLLWAAS